MVKNIKLFYNMGKFANEATIINLDEDIEFVLEYDKPTGSRLYYCVSNGESVSKGAVVNNKFKVSSSFIKLGKLSIKIEVEVLGKIIKSFMVEDLIIIELDENIVAIPQIEEHDKRLIELEKKIEDMENKLNLFIKLWKEEI